MLEIQNSKKSKLAVQKKPIRFYTLAYTIVFSLLIFGLFAYDEITMTPANTLLTNNVASSVQKAAHSQYTSEPISTPLAHGYRHQPLHPGGQPSSNTKKTATAQVTHVNKVYVVVQGDTLSAIALHYHIAWVHLAHYNHLTNPNLILIGQVIRIP